jgi:small subunit ribosomal protein S14
LTTAKRVKDAKIEKKFDDARGKGPKPKFSSRRHNRCKLCGRPRAYLRKFGICRLCFRGRGRPCHTSKQRRGFFGIEHEPSKQTGD